MVEQVKHITCSSVIREHVIPRTCSIESMRAIFKRNIINHYYNITLLIKYSRGIIARTIGIIINFEKIICSIR